ncbi:19S/PA700 proteasome regulatory particle subunit Rpt1p/S7 [Enterocytozoon bieneusi H348]|nr:19S/PA700 proteasome regulatory particle subunit Rpt1p/S7 [Enterocytozoon bieneusi H348]|eukprot:XP_002649934.1 19S/PA700 proteasome regulatory particle subunit Rpt1p/S7 [Enterocytozoon bieneusi H348]
MSNNNKESINLFDNASVTNLVQLNKSYYSDSIVQLENEIIKLQDKISLKLGTKEVETGLAPPYLWNLDMDRHIVNTNQPLQVAKVVKIISGDPEYKYMISIKQMAKFIVGKNKNLEPVQIYEGMRVGVDRMKYALTLPLPRKIDSSVTLMQVEEKPEVTYDDIGGCKEEIEKVREVVEDPLLNPDKYIELGIDPPKGVLLYGPPGTGKTLLARAVANRTNACFIRVIGSELIQKYVGEGARMIREIFNLARTKSACIIFFDEVDSFGSTRFGDSEHNEIQRTMLELINQLDGFDSRGNIKVIMATNRPDILDPALLRPGRLDRKIEFKVPDLEGRTKIFKINTKTMSVEKNIRYDLLARMASGSTGAELRAVCIEAGMFAIRERRKIATENDFFKAIEKVIKEGGKFSSTPKYMTYN